MNGTGAGGGRTLRRYLAFQTAGWIVAVLAAVMAVRLDIAGPALAIIVVLAWIAKDLMLYRFVRHAYETGVASPVDRLLGTFGMVELDLAPEGMVRVGHEVWTAREKGETPIEAGSRVRVVAVEGLVLIVERAGA